MDNEDFLRTVAGIMVKKVVTFSRDTPVFDVAKRMTKDQISCVVVSEDKIPVGMVTERDLIDQVIVHKHEANTVKMESVMTHPVMTIRPDDEIVPVGELMKQRKVRRFPVVNDKGHLVGLVTETDILEGIIKLVKHLDWQLIKTKITVEEYINKLRQARIL